MYAGKEVGAVGRGVACKSGHWAALAKGMRKYLSRKMSGEQLGTEVVGMDSVVLVAVAW